MKVNNGISSKILKRAFIFLSVLFTCQVANASDTEPIKLLFIGNSYTQMNEMPSLLQKMVSRSGKNSIIERSTESGASFKDHSERADMYDAIKSRKWDYIILQGYSRELSYTPGYIDTETVPYLNKIMDSIHASNACTTVLFFMTWGYENGFLDREEVNTYEKMADSIKRGYRYVGSLYNAPVVPVGMVWKSAKQKKGVGLYASDGAHPNIKGSYLAACTFYHVLFNELPQYTLTTSLSSGLALTIQEEVNRFMTENKMRYKWNENTFSLVPFTTAEGEHTLTFSSDFPLATTIKWSFGDGSYSEALSGRHVFKKPGTYKVTIEAQERCGLKIQQKTITFEKFKRRRFKCLFRRNKRL